MPKVILEFNTPEENSELHDAQNGQKYVVALNEFANFLRAKLKYEELDEATYKVYEEVREKFYEIRNEYSAFELDG